MGRPTKLSDAINDLIRDQGWGGNISDAECNSTGEGGGIGQ